MSMCVIEFNSVTGVFSGKLCSKQQKKRNILLTVNIPEEYETLQFDGVFTTD